MATHDDKPTGPDLAAGISAASLADGAAVHGHVGEEPVALARVGDDFLAIGGKCSHYGGPLGKGLVTGDTIHCPWHHACFSLRTGEALRAPAFDPVAVWRVERDGDRSSSATSCPSPRPPRSPTGDARHFVIVGGGAAGFAAAERLRREGFAGELTLISADAERPVDRPNLSKDFLAGKAPEVLGVPQARRPSSSAAASGSSSAPPPPPSMPPRRRLDARRRPQPRLRPAAARHRRRAGPPRHPRRRQAARLHPARARRQPRHHRRRRRGQGRGGDRRQLHRPRSRRVADRRAASRPRRRPRRPAAGERSSAPSSAISSAPATRRTASPSTSAAGRPRSRTAPSSSTTAPGSPPTSWSPASASARAPRSPKRAGLAHRQRRPRRRAGSKPAPPASSPPATSPASPIRSPAAARCASSIGWSPPSRASSPPATCSAPAVRYDHAPFFWSRHFDLAIDYVGHAGAWDATEIDGDLASGRALVRYRRAGELTAVASIGRGRDSLRAERALEAGAQ